MSKIEIRFVMAAAMLCCALAGASFAKEYPLTRFPTVAPATQAVEDADLVIVRTAILKSLPKLKAADVTPTKTMGALGARDITFMEIIGDMQIATELTFSDAAVEKTVNANASKQMSDVTVQQLVQLLKSARAPK